MFKRVTNSNHPNKIEARDAEWSKPSQALAANDSSGANFNRFEIPSINLPKGGGGIKGIEEKFKVNSVTGTSSFELPIPFSPSRRGFVPAINLIYNSGSGNGVFGMGWDVGVPKITRKTGNRLPQYRDEEESDIFILSGAEDLIPLLENDDGEWKPYQKQITESGVSFTVKRYCPRIEGSFAIIEKWKNNANGEKHWRTVTRDNVHSYFGTTPASRLSDPEDATKICEWRLSRTHDDKGNVCLFEYKKEDYANVENKLSEKNRAGKCTQVYLKKILYGNRKPYYLGEAIPAETEFLFKVIFDYGEHDSSESVPKDVDAEKNSWASRKDAFSDYRAGFEVRTYRRCRRVLMFHCFDAADLPHNPYLTKSLQLFYDDDSDSIENENPVNGFSYLVRARQNGHLWNAAADSYSTKSLPEFEFTYQPHEWNTKIETVAEENTFGAPAGLSDRRYLWIDLFGEGVAGILTEQAGGWFYKSNLGDGKFSAALAVSPQPNFRGLASGKTSILELEGDGAKYLVQHSAEPKGFFKLDEESKWQPFKNFETTPNLNPDNHNNLRAIDLSGDGCADLLLTEDDKIRWYPGEGEKGFAVSRAVSRAIDEEKGPAVLFADRAQSIFLADMNGDGLTDIVRITNGEICYWANLGYGRFGAKVAMDNAPLFDHPDCFKPSNLRLADVDGSGTTDIVYLGKNDFRVWLNLNGNEWTSEPQIVSPFPAISDLSDVAVLDFLGAGTACIVYSSSLPQHRRNPLQYIDLMNGKKPYLLVKYENNCGREVSIEYEASTKYYLEDKKAGAPWITKLPFPVHCIARIRSEDKIRETVFTSSYRYRHGYFDRAEKEFRGFARVEQLDTEQFSRFKLNAAKNVVSEEFHQPPVKVVSWFHTGAFLGNDKILHQCRNEYFQNAEFDEYDLPEPIIAEDLPADELREALRALKGLPLRSEIYAEDESASSDKPYSASHSTVEIRRLQPKDKNRFACFLVVASESISYGYERNPADPRVAHSLVLETDELGAVKKSASVVYPRARRPLAPDRVVPDEVWEEQNKLHVVYHETFYTQDAIDESRSVYRLRAECESKSFEVSGVAPRPARYFFKKADLIADIAAATEISFEEDFAGGKQKRLSAHGRAYFLDDNLAAELPLGELSGLGIAHCRYQLAFTKNLIGKYYGTKVTDQMLFDAKYVRSENDAHWWAPTATAIYAANPKNNFYAPVGSRDAFGNENFVEYDAFTLLLKSTTDAIGNRSTAVNDYRTLSPVMMTDANLNRTAVERDELGMVVKSAVMGKTGAGEGDTLADPTARLEYDLFNWKNNRQPNFAHAFAREKHGAANPRWQESYVYADGGGAVIMTKTQAEPGKARRWNAAAKKLDEADADPRWIGNGRTVFNNKGNPVKQYEPYFSQTHEYETEAALIETGFSPLLYYDPLGRNIKTEFPNGTFTRTEFDSWFFKSYDANDTVKASRWYAERGSPDPHGSEPPDPEQRAAWLAAKHADTPATTYTDSLGNPFYAVTDYGGGKRTRVYSETDLSGRYSFVFDQRDRKVAESYTNLAGAVIYSKSAEKGEQWVLTDALGRLVRAWDNNTREYRTTYDKLHRPLSSFVREGAAEFLYNHILYADYFFTSQAAQNLNLKGRAFRVYDQAGSITLERADFKGNVLSVERRLVRDYKARITDWKVLDGIDDLTAIDAAANSLLETEAFTAGGEVDALNRPTEITAPDGTVSRLVYNEANYLDSLRVKLRGQGGFITFLEAQDYDAKGQRQYARYGNGTITNYFYDPQTYRLTNLLTKLTGGDANAEAIQNLSYTFDPVGNITQIRDAAQQKHFFANSVVSAENKYEYDAVYQLKKATGREHAGLGASLQRNHLDVSFIAQLPHSNDANAVRNYTEEYEYDDCGNILRLRHQAPHANWTKRYRYEYEDDPANKTNRLKATGSDADADGVFSLKYFHDAHGNMTSMPHLPAPNSLIWNFIDQLKEVNLSGGGTAYYVYGRSGNRIRKVVERPGGLIKERIYLGGVEIYRERQGSNAPHLERQTVHISDDTGRIAQVDTKTIDAANSDPSNPLNTSLIRYQYANHLGSAALETDAAGQIISYEEYHPFGTSAYRISKSNANFSLKRYRFSGKERDDETGFYYFGARYYAAWLGRWTSSDPAGFVSGKNLYRYCSNNPIVFYDPNGLQERVVIPVVRDNRFGRGASFSDLIANIPSGYQLRSGITAENYTQHWDSRTKVWDILERSPSSSAPTSPSSSGGSSADSSSETVVSPSPENPIESSGGSRADSQSGSAAGSSTGNPGGSSTGSPTGSPNGSPGGSSSGSEGGSGGGAEEDDDSWFTSNFFKGLVVGLVTAVAVIAVVATAGAALAVIAPAASAAIAASGVGTALAYAGAATTAYSFYQSANQRSFLGDPISREQAEFNMGLGVGSVFAGAAARPISSAFAPSGQALGRSLSGMMPPPPGGGMLALPGGGTFGGAVAAPAAGVRVVPAATGAAIATSTTGMMMANNGDDFDDDFESTQRVGRPGRKRPGNNQDQNKQVRDLANKYGLSKDQQRKFHDAIQGMDLDYAGLEAELLDTFPNLVRK